MSNIQLTRYTNTRNHSTNDILAELWKVWLMMVDTTAKTATYTMGMQGVDRVSEEIVLELVVVKEAFNVGAEAWIRVELEVIELK